MVTNAQSIISKVNELKAWMAINKPDIVALTETWTHGGIANEYLHVDGYEILGRSDRNDTERGRGGGIFIFVEKSINARKLDENPNFDQNLSIEIRKRGEDVKLHVIYR